MIKKNVGNLIESLKMDGEFGVSPFLNDGHELAAFIRVLREFIVTNMSIFQSSNLFYHA